MAPAHLYVRAALGPCRSGLANLFCFGRLGLEEATCVGRAEGWAVLGVDGVVTKSVNLDHERVWEPNLDASFGSITHINKHTP
jgi:hypothetical protein